jgi:sugar phosphate isomerase/epimerase
VHVQAATFFDRYAVSTWLFGRRPLDEALRQIAGAGFRWVEIWADGFHLDPRLDVDIDALCRLLDELGLRVHSVHTPFSGLNLGHPEQGDRAQWRQLIGASIRQAGALGAVAAVVHPSGHREPLPEELHPASRQAVRDLVAELVEIAAESGTRVALENMIDYGFWRYGRSLAELSADFPDPRIGFCLDTGHAAINGLDPVEEIRAAGPRLISIHAANNDGRSDLHYPPTEGALDWARIEAALQEAGYQGKLVLETAARGDPAAMLERLGRLWQELP